MLVAKDAAGVNREGPGQLMHLKESGSYLEIKICPKKHPETARSGHGSLMRVMWVKLW